VRTLTCLEVAATRTVVRVKLDELPDRCPAFAAAVRGLGVRSYLSAPLRLAEDHVVALNLYSVDGHGFSDLDAALLKIYTTVGETIVGIRVARLGRTSVTYDLGLFPAGLPETAAVAARGRWVHVYVDRDTRRPVPIPDGLRRLFESAIG